MEENRLRKLRRNGNMIMLAMIFDNAIIIHDSGCFCEKIHTEFRLQVSLQAIEAISIKFAARFFCVEINSLIFLRMPNRFVWLLCKMCCRGWKCFSLFQKKKGSEK
jgi:hypothetical protein